MDDFPPMKICQTIQDTFGHLAQYLFTSATTQLPNLLVDAVQAPTFTEFHRDRNGTSRLVHECTVVATDVIRSAMFVEIEFANDLLFDVGVRVRGDNLMLLACGRRNQAIVFNQPSMQTQSSLP